MLQIHHGLPTIMAVILRADIYVAHIHMNSECIYPNVHSHITIYVRSLSDTSKQANFHIRYISQRQDGLMGYGTLYILASVCDNGL